MSRAVPYTFDDIIFQHDAAKYMLKRRLITRAEYNRTIRALNDEQDRRDLAERLRLLALRAAQAGARKAEKRKAYNAKRKAEHAKINNVAKLNTVVNLSGVLTDFDTQIVLPMMIGLNTLAGVKDAHFHMTYGTNGVINELFKPQGNDGTAIYWNNLKQFLMVYANGELVPIIPAGASFHIVILKADNISPAYIKQIYRDGEVHCVLNPLYNMWINMATASESDAAKNV